jgi:phosphotransferase system IIA component
VDATLVAQLMETNLVPTDYAAGVTSDKGMEIVIHIGITLSNSRGKIYKNWHGSVSA